jgi:hypothetical protein
MFSQEDMEVFPINKKVLPQDKGFANKWRV